MAATTLAQDTVAEVMAELAALEDPKIRAVNEKHGDDHGVNLGKLRALAKRLKTQQELARQLWDTDDSAARLLALLICRPKAFERDELDTMLRESRIPKVHDWLVNYVVKKNPHAEALRLAWFADPDPVVASAGWALTTERVAKQPRRPRPPRAARCHRGADEGRSGSLAVGDEPLSGADRDRARRSTAPGPSTSVSAWRCSRSTRRPRTARLRSRRSGSPRWCAASRRAEELARPSAA